MIISYVNIKKNLSLKFKVMDIWTEKYRPKKLDEIYGQVSIVKRLKSFVKSKSMPHLLFSGPAGTGKSTCALAIARELYGDEWGHNFIELNASDERGIDVIRGKIKDFARTMPIGGMPFKLILLDEADSLTKDAQHALRRTMEKYAGTCRFILDCNYSSKIIDPIQSRCAVFRFKPLEEGAVIELLKEVSSKEGLKISDEALKALYEISRGDLRKAINLLQATASISKNVDVSLIYEVASYAKPDEITKVVKLALDGNFEKAKNLMMDTMLKYGLSGIDAIKQLHSQVIKMDLPHALKIKLIDKIGEYEFRIVEGADEYLQIDALIAQMCYLGSAGL